MSLPNTPPLTVADPFQTVVLRLLWLIIQIIAARPEGMGFKQRQMLDAGMAAAIEAAGGEVTTKPQAKRNRKD